MVGQGIISIAELIRSDSHQIIDLDLSGNSIGVAGASMLGEALIHNKCLQILNLSCMLMSCI